VGHLTGDTSQGCALHRFAVKTPTRSRRGERTAPTRRTDWPTFRDEKRGSAHLS